LITKSALQVYSGQKFLGEIEDHGRRRVVAFKIDDKGCRRKVGTFATRVLAMRAVVNVEARECGA
jgi:hypothetical protein